jgi:hypothetical protein
MIYFNTVNNLIISMLSLNHGLWIMTQTSPIELRINSNNTRHSEGGGEGGLVEVSHFFLLLKTLFLMLLEEKLCITKQNKASKDTYFLTLLIL